MSPRSSTSSGFRPATAGTAACSRSWPTSTAEPRRVLEPDDRPLLAVGARSGEAEQRLHRGVHDLFRGSLRSALALKVVDGAPRGSRRATRASRLSPEAFRLSDFAGCMRSVQR